MTTMTSGQVTAPTARPLPAISDVVPEKFLSKRHVARRLGKTIRTVDHWMQRGLLPYYKIGRSVSFRWSEVERRLAEFHVSGSAQAKLPRPMMAKKEHRDRKSGKPKVASQKRAPSGQRSASPSPTVEWL